MTRHALRILLSGLLLTAAISACGPMQVGADVADTRTQGDTGDAVQPSDTIDVIDANNDVPHDMIVADVIDVVTGDASDVTGPDSIDVPSSDGPSMDGGTGRCATTMPLTLGGMVRGTLSGASEFDATMCQSAASGPEQVFTLHLGAMTGVVFDTTGTLDTIVTVRSACSDASSEIACDDNSGPGSLTSLRAVLAAGDYFVIVDQRPGSTGGTGGAFTLSATAFTPAANADCTMATPFSDVAPASGDTTTATARARSCATFAEGPVLYYSIVVPPNSRATLTATPSGFPAWSPVIRVQDSCAATTCVANSASVPPGSNAVVTVDNRDTSPRMYIVSVGSTMGTTGGPFSLTESYETIATTANAVCSNATTVTDGTMLSGEDVGLGADTLTTACLPSSTGRVLYYSATIPAGNVLTVMGTPSGSLDLVLRLLDACGASSCLASANTRVGGGGETLRFVNTGSTARDVIIAAGSNTMVTTGLFDLWVVITPQPANANCSTPTTITDGTNLATENAALATTTLTSACGTAPGGNLFYSASIPAGSVFIVTATPGGAWDPVIRVLDSCGASSCIASSDARGAGAAETLRYTNTSGAVQNVIVAVGADSAATSGIYSLTAQIHVPPYVESTTATSCDDMSGAPIVPGLTGDDAASAIAPLPFTLQFMGTAATHVSVSTNGFAQLWPDTSGTASSEFSNAAIPTAVMPNGFVAPFWDDLVPDASSSVRAGEITTGARHFTIQWSNFAFSADSTMTARITMQAKLFETTSRIEFHYCSITPVGTSTITSGSSASVGVENLAGDDGFQHSFDAASSVDTANAIVLTPAP